MQISEILSNYTSSSEGFVTLRSLIMNSLMLHERELLRRLTTASSATASALAAGTATALSSPSAFPAAAHQLCVAHLKRQVLNSVSHRDKAAVAQELEEVFRMEDKRVDSLWGYEHFITFADRWAKKYPALRRYRTGRSIADFTYMDFPAQVQRCIYITNWIERLNRKYKRVVKMRNAMPSVQAVIFLLGTVVKMETEHAYARRLYQIRCWTGRKQKP